MTTPLIRGLAKNNIKVDYCVGNYSKGGIAGNKYLNQIISFKDEEIYGKNKKLSEIIKLIKQIRKENYDIIFVLDKSWIAGVFVSFCGKFRIGFDRYGEGFANNLNVKYGPVKHEREYYAELAKFLGIKIKNLDIDLFLKKEDKEFANDLFKKHNLHNAIGIIPGGAKNPAVGVDDVRRWPLKNFAELVKKIKQPIILIGGPDDKEIAQYVIKESGKKDIINVVGKCTIPQSAAIMQKCSKLVCNDSGPMHMASALNKHVISIFGASNPARKAPIAKESVAIWKDQDIYEEDYEVYGIQPKNKQFMKRIKVEDVLKYL